LKGSSAAKKKFKATAARTRRADRSGKESAIAGPQAAAGSPPRTTSAAQGRDFVFAWKASKFITYWKRLSNDSVNSLDLLEDRLSLLGRKAGPILFQLPPNFKADADRLFSFVKLLSKKRRYSFEFRHSSWYAPKILRLLAARHIAVHIRSS
jgi:uncharacterized protein YecE (DUF72 family)